MILYTFLIGSYARLKELELMIGKWYTFHVIMARLVCFQALPSPTFLLAWKRFEVRTTQSRDNWIFIDLISCCNWIVVVQLCIRSSNTGHNVVVGTTATYTLHGEYRKRSKLKVWTMKVMRSRESQKRCPNEVSLWWFGFGPVLCWLHIANVIQLRCFI